MGNKAYDVLMYEPDNDSGHQYKYADIKVALPQAHSHH